MVLAAACWLALWQLLLVVRAGGHMLLVPVSSSKKTVASAHRETQAGTALAKAVCEAAVNRDDLQLGLRLGLQFLARSQRAAGNFRYEYNWLLQEESEKDSATRQAGTLWALTLLHVDEPKSELMAVIHKAMQYFEQHSVEFPGGLRMVIYPGKTHQKLGAVALLALAHIEMLRRPEALASAMQKHQLEARLAGYLRTILAARTGNNNFHKYYNDSSGKAFGPSWHPHVDGQSLLALVKAAKYLGYDELWTHIKVSAESGWRKNVLPGLKFVEGKKQDNKHKKNALHHLMQYYQWGSMAWYELVGMEDPEFAKYARRMLRYGHWALGRPLLNCDVKYFEGLIPAFVTAVQQGDERLSQKFACAVREGVENLHSMQVGHTKFYMRNLTGFAELRKDKRAQGGAQSLPNEPILRIDITQHQLHALLMAKRLLQQTALI